MSRLQLKMMKGGEEKEGRTGYDERRFKRKWAIEIKRESVRNKGQNIKRPKKRDSTGGERETGKRKITKQKSWGKKKVTRVDSLLGDVPRHR